MIKSCSWNTMKCNFCFMPQSHFFSAKAKNLSCVSKWKDCHFSTWQKRHMKIDKGRISFWWHYKNPSTISYFFYRLQTYDFIRTSLLKMSHKTKFENNSWKSEIINIDEVRESKAIVMRQFYWFSSTVAWRKKEELGREATGYERLLGASLDQWQDVLFTLFPPQKEELSLLLRREREGFLQRSLKKK